MAKTTELYYESAYIRDFDATVLECDKNEAGKYEIILDRTAFFPEQGGQSSDLGTFVIGSEKADVYNVLHVSIDKEGVIRHLTDREIPTGCRVHGTIDWDHRFSNMQQHTGEHIFSGIVHAKYGFENVGFHLSDSEVTMDYNGVLDASDIKNIEMSVNQAIWENVRVLCNFPDKDELDKLEYRSKKELTGDVRIVTVEGYDVCACCAPHVDRTGEIGILKVVSCQNYKGGVRVSILCGKRALEYISREHEIIGELTGLLTTSPDKIVSSYKKMSEENNRLLQELNGAREKLIAVEISEIDKEQKDVFLIKEDGLDGNVIRKTVNALTMEHSGFCGVFSGSPEAGYRFVIGSGSDKKDCKMLLEVLKQECGAKGGGSPQMIQGSFNTRDIRGIVSKLA